MSHSLVIDWIGYHADGLKASDPRASAWTEVDGLVREDPEAGWALILDLVVAAPDEHILANVAAGPLEDLLRRDPARFIDRVEQQARRDPRFRRCLTGVWGLPASIRDRIGKYTSAVTDPL